VPAMAASARTAAAAMRVKCSMDILPDIWTGWGSLLNLEPIVAPQ
jgi:hypothetical protein